MYMQRAMSVQRRVYAHHTLLPKTALRAGTPRRVSDSSSTSSCRRDATWMSSVISAMRCSCRLISEGCSEGGRRSISKNCAAVGDGESADAISSKMVGRSRLPWL